MKHSATATTTYNTLKTTKHNTFKQYQLTACFTASSSVYF